MAEIANSKQIDRENDLNFFYLSANYFRFCIGEGFSRNVGRTSCANQSVALLGISRLIKNVELCHVLALNQFTLELQPKPRQTSRVGASQ